MKVLARSTAVAFALSIILAGVAYGQQRPFFPNGNGIAFLSLTDVEFGLFSENSNGDFIRAVLTGNEGDFLRVTPNGRVFVNANDHDADLLVCLAPPAGDGFGCIDDDGAFTGDDHLVGSGRVSFNFFTSTQCGNISFDGTVFNTAGDGFRVTSHVVQVPTPNGSCRVISESVELSPLD